MPVRVAMDVPLVALEAAVQGLVGINIALLGALRGQVPRLYDSGVRYREPGKTKWHNVADVIDLNYGDCKDLVAYRVAELQFFDGEAARPHVYLTRRARKYHVIVVRGDGTEEDPSAIIHDLERNR